MSTSIHILIGWVDVEEIHGDTTYKTFKKTRKKHENKQSCMLEITYLVSGVFRFQINFLKKNNVEIVNTIVKQQILPLFLG